MNYCDDSKIMATLGEVALRAHLIEDLLRLHLFEAGRFNMGGVERRTVRQITELGLQEVIGEFSRMHGGQQAALDLLRQIRNKLFHAFCTEVGDDLLTDGGR